VQQKASFGFRSQAGYMAKNEVKSICAWFMEKDLGGGQKEKN
jgi:hypothetical protein